MLIALGFAFLSVISIAQNVQCIPGQVMAVDHGRDYTLNVCGVGLVALRGVEPPLRSAVIAHPPIGGGELLGGKNVAPDAVAFLSTLVGQRVTPVYDGWRIGDSARKARRYAYVISRGQDARERADDPARLRSSRLDARRQPFAIQPARS